MISEEQQELACLYALGALPDSEAHSFETLLRESPELRELVRDLKSSTDALALTSPGVELPRGLKAKLMEQIDTLDAGHRHLSPVQPKSAKPELVAGLRFHLASDTSDWKALPIPGASIKLLSLERERGYAVLLGKLEPGTRYPAHVNAGPEDFYILTGDLHIGDTELKAGDFHHAEGGSQHVENHSVDGCTLLAVLTVDDPLVAFAMEK